MAVHVSGLPKPSLAPRRVAMLFGAFAFGYFLSALLRAIVATLAPVFAEELSLNAGQLGLLAGAYFLGFAVMQLPLGAALDRFGPRRVLSVMLSLAVAGCLAFAAARTFPQLIGARLLIGLGVAASLMAPLTAFARLLAPALQLRLNSWMLMSGSLGMVASTLPVQTLLPAIGWRGLFVAIALLLLLAMAGIAVAPPCGPSSRAEAGDRLGYFAIVRHPAFTRALPLGFFTYGGLIAVQSLWAGPWLTQVAGQSPREAAQGLLFINLGMLLSFLGWGVAMPRLVRLGFTADRLIRLGWPLGVIVMGGVLALGPQAGAAWWTLWCVTTSPITLVQPAVAQAFPIAAVGRALSAFNLVIFLGVFVNQWGMGLVIDALAAAGWDTTSRFRAAFALHLLGMASSGVWFWQGLASHRLRGARTHR